MKPKINYKEIAILIGIFGVSLFITLQTIPSQWDTYIITQCVNESENECIYYEYVRFCANGTYSKEKDKCVETYNCINGNCSGRYYEVVEILSKDLNVENLNLKCDCKLDARCITEVHPENDYGFECGWDTKNDAKECVKWKCGKLKVDKY